MGRLDGHVAIVTGASRGLGRAIAVAMAAEGAAVAVAARTERVWDERLPGTIGETVAAIEAIGGRAIPVRADILDPADRTRLVEATRAAFGPVTILVNNAAFTAPGSPERPPRAAPQRAAASGGAPAKVSWPTIMTTPLRAYGRHFDMVFAAYDLIRMVVPDMTAAGGGAIINVTSGASRIPGDGPYPDRSYGALAGYGGSKAALEHLTRCVAYELADARIAANALSPSRAIRTPGVEYYAKVFADTAPESDFAEAAVRLALADPERITGKVVGHEDVLDGSFRPYALSSA